MRARALMVLGTASHVGKSILTAALGRILVDEGYRVAPFKAQNMALNSAATPAGEEIGRAQAMQAEACRVAARVEMNPILIKPSSDTGAQVVVLGRVWGQVTAADYHQGRVEELFPIVLESYQKLAAEHDIILIEGAGSPAEINLKKHDIVNMRMAQIANAACLLVGDIDRGGVFASLLGTLELLEPQERALVRGFVINKFRGDIALLTPGIRMIEERLACPSMGVIPYLRDLGIEEEDGVAMEERRTPERTWRGAADPAVDSPLRPLRIGVIALPHMANFTDFDALAAEPSVALAYIERPPDIAHADLLILPGTKQTLDDFSWLRQAGFADAISTYREARGRILIGICGGLQMLGRWIEDPYGVENDGEPRKESGLGLLPISTVFSKAKRTLCVTGRLCRETLFGQHLSTSDLRGYEIHAGETIYGSGATPFASIKRTATGSVVVDGAVNSDGSVIGTYVHGLFDDDRFRHSFIEAARAFCRLSPCAGRSFHGAKKQERFDRLATAVRESLDLDSIRGWLRL